MHEIHENLNPTEITNHTVASYCISYTAIIIAIHKLLTLETFPTPTYELHCTFYYFYTAVQHKNNAGIMLPTIAIYCSTELV